MATYLHVLTGNAFAYLLEATHIQGHVWGILLPNASKMVNNHFANDSLLSISVERSSIDGVRACLDLFCSTSSVVVSD